jgi:arylformamidase
MNREWIDISVPLHNGMAVWPGDPPMHIERIASIADGHTSNVSAISSGLHAGTHIDAPLHFLDGRASVAEMPPGALVGPARVVAIRDPKAIRLRDVEPLRVRRGERILFRTRNSKRCWRTSEFCLDYVYLTSEAAAHLVERGVAVVGIDYLSIGARDEDGHKVHRMLLQAGVWIIEGLDLSAAPAGRYDLACLPLKVVGADGALARAIVRPKRNRSPAA